LKQLDPDRMFLTWRRGAGAHGIKMNCCDASEHLSEKMENFCNVVAFSATLKPFNYYARLSGFNLDKLSLAEFVSPFPKEHRKLMVIPQVSTKFRDRASQSSKIREAIQRIIATKRGNYFIFFPSFDFLEMVAKDLKIPGFRLLKQTRNMSRGDVDMILSDLKKKSRNQVILAVQGGVFGEGVDYPGDMLIGTIVVGPALPAWNLERETLRGYYDQHYGDGFNYAYAWPAMARVIQSAGRVIRSPKDRGVVILMDQRFADKTYTDVMPDDWFEHDVCELISSTIISDLDEFWSH